MNLIFVVNLSGAVVVSTEEVAAVAIDLLADRSRTIRTTLSIRIDLISRIDHIIQILMAQVRIEIRKEVIRIFLIKAQVRIKIQTSNGTIT